MHEKEKPERGDSTRAQRPARNHSLFKVALNSIRLQVMLNRSLPKTKTCSWRRAAISWELCPRPVTQSVTERERKREQAKRRRMKLAIAATRNTPRRSLLVGRLATLFEVRTVLEVVARLEAGRW